MAYKNQPIRDDLFDCGNDFELDSSWKTSEVGWVGLTKVKIECHELKDSSNIFGKQIVDMEKHNPREEVKCQLCYKNFTKENFTLHILKEHWRNEVTKCSFCDEKFENMNFLKSHIRQNHLKESSTCNICNKTCKNLNG